MSPPKTIQPPSAVQRPKTILAPETPVLVIDDNVQYSRILYRMLEQAFGYKSVTVVDSLAAGYDLLAAPNSAFTLLFVDYRFPNGENGADLIQRLQREGLLQARLAFLITSEPNLDNMKQVLAAGAQGVIAKPFDRAELKRQLEKAERGLTIEQGDAF